MAYSSSVPSSQRLLALALVAALTSAGCPSPDTASDDSTASGTSSGDLGTTSSGDGPPTPVPTGSDPSTEPAVPTSTGTSADADPTVAVDPSTTTTTGDTTTGDTTTGDTTTETSTTTAVDPSGDTTTTSDTTSTGAEDTTTGSTTDDDTSGEPEVIVCGEGDILDAPPSTMVDGMFAVPIDVVSVTASAVIDWTAKAATMKATMKFRLGPEGGHPLFDTRQLTFTKIELDGMPLTSGQILHRDLGGGDKAEMRVIALDLPACSEHVLVLEYPLDDPPNSTNILSYNEWEQAVLWSFGSSDVSPGYMVERWMPANLTYDRFKLTMTVQVLDSPSEQVVYANGDIQELGFHKWKISYPAHFRSFSPMFRLQKGGKHTHSSAILEPKGGDPVELDVFLEADVGKTHEEVQAEIAGYFDEFIESTGPYHLDRFYVLINPGDGAGMEYEGATSTGYLSLKHQLFHGWFGRGLKPRHTNDAWLDESWTEYVVDEVDVPVLPLDFAAPPVVLCSDNPWSRHMPLKVFGFGQRVFATIAAATGEADLRLAMKLFYELRAPGLFSTAELEQHLYCELQEPVIRDVFHRFVYGKDGPTPELPPGYCP
ncbi:hypothetical protein OV090_35880 [Nannocystis sp. RBIL2]|uniref:hypothetical protein n=1 Tax=Nannocystis sp. RBIL2 TaxID=2996788 RepID=UPI00226DBD76|nr:hypothetical protein [Nannocystis sp. RBIL2]MCY1070179.1 hypothetical protein [Nannocystis sp. RBIL2]